MLMDVLVTHFKHILILNCLMMWWNFFKKGWPYTVPLPVNRLSTVKLFSSAVRSTHLWVKTPAARKKTTGTEEMGVEPPIPCTVTMLQEGWSFEKILRRVFQLSSSVSCRYCVTRRGRLRWYNCYANGFSYEETQNGKNATTVHDGYW